MRSRDLATRFNHRYGDTFRVPDGQFPEVGGRIMDLQDPTSKMSTTTSAEQGAIYVSDPPDTIEGTAGPGCGTGHAGLLAHRDEVPATLHFGGASIEFRTAMLALRRARTCCR